MVPAEPPYPVSTYGLRLGARVSHIRNRGDYDQYRDELDRIEFEWVVWQDTAFRDILSAMAQEKWDQDRRRRLI